MGDSIERLSFELSTRSLREQERILTGMRTSAGTVIAAASVALSLRGATAGRAGLDWWGVSALVAYVLVLTSAIWVMLPHELTFALRGGDLRFRRIGGRAPSLAIAYRAASLWVERHVDENRRVLARLSACLSVSCLLLLVEVLSIVLDAPGTV